MSSFQYQYHFEQNADRIFERFLFGAFLYQPLIPKIVESITISEGNGYSDGQRKVKFGPDVQLRNFRNSTEAIGKPDEENRVLTYQVSGGDLKKVVTGYELRFVPAEGGGSDLIVTINLVDPLPGEYINIQAVLTKALSLLAKAD